LTISEQIQTIEKLAKIDELAESRDKLEKEFEEFKKYHAEETESLKQKVREIELQTSFFVSDHERAHQRKMKMTEMLEAVRELRENPGMFDEIVISERRRLGLPTRSRRK